MPAIISLHLDEWSRVAGWFSYSDADGNPRPSISSGTAGPARPAPTTGRLATAPVVPASLITVSAADLANTWVRGAHVAGAETLWVRALRRHWWSNYGYRTPSALANTKPVATINDHNLRTNEWSQVSSWLSPTRTQTPILRPEYQFWDSGTGATSGYFLDVGQQPLGCEHDHHRRRCRSRQHMGARRRRRPARRFSGCAPLRQLATGATGIRSPSTTIPNTPPVATIGDHNLHTNEWSQVSGVDLLLGRGVEVAMKPLMRSSVSMVMRALAQPVHQLAVIDRTPAERRLRHIGAPAKSVIWLRISSFFISPGVGPPLRVGQSGQGQ